MRKWWWAALLFACSNSKPQPPPYVDEWTTRPLEPFSNKLVEDALLDPATVAFTIQLPHGMFHDPRSTPEHAHDYGVWTADGPQDPNTPGVDIRLAPHGPATLEAFVAQDAMGEEVVAKDKLADGTLTITTRRGTRSWRVEQIHFDHAGHKVQCDTWRHDDQHDLGDATRRMLEKICGSLVIAEPETASGSAAAPETATRQCKTRVEIYKGMIEVDARTYVHPALHGDTDVNEPIPALDRVLSKAPRIELTLDYPFEKPFTTTVTGPITLRRVIDAVRAGFRHMYEGTTQRDIPKLENKDVTGPYGRAFHAIGDLVIESIDLCDDSWLDISIGS
jgi:hypothetical protein